MAASASFSFEDGMRTLSCIATLALRIRVSMSAMGSVIVIRELLPYQLALVTPGTSPACTSSRRQIRHSPNLRNTECGRPHRRHRVYARTLYLGLRCCFWMSAFLAIALLPFASEWEAEGLEQGSAGGVGAGGRDDGDVHAPGGVD